VEADMDEVIFGEILKKISIVAIIVGALTGLDLLSGARALSALNKISARRLSLDDAITRPMARIILGVVFLVICVFLLLVVLRTG